MRRFRGGEVPAEAFGYESTLTYQNVHGRSLEGNALGDAADRHVIVFLPPSYFNCAGAPLSGGLSPARLQRHELELDAWVVSGLQHSAGDGGPDCRRNRAGDDRRVALRAQHLRRQLLRQLAGDRQLGELHRRRSGGLHRRQLSHPAAGRQPRPGRAVDGRLRRALHRREAAGCLRRRLRHERRVPRLRRRSRRPRGMADDDRDQEP